jgi:hypothetical protein
MPENARNRQGKALEMAEFFTGDKLKVEEE